MRVRGGVMAKWCGALLVLLLVGSFGWWWGGVASPAADVGAATSAAGAAVVVTQSVTGAPLTLTASPIPTPFVDPTPTCVAGVHGIDANAFPNNPRGIPVGLKRVANDRTNIRDLWLIPLGDTTKAVALTSCSRGSGYGGVTQRDGQTDLYFSSQETGGSSGGVFGVYRVRIGGGQPERLFEFKGNTKHNEWSCCNVAVTLDGTRAVYADLTGLRLRDLRDGRDLLLVPHERESNNFSPRWSPDGRYVTFFRVSYEGGAPQFVETAVTPFAVREFGDRDARESGEAGAWSPDSSLACVLGAYGHSWSKGGFFDISSGRRRDVVVEGAPAVSPFRTSQRMDSCAWSKDGRVAAAFAEGDPINGLQWLLTVSDRNLRLLRTFDLPGSVVAWVDDSSAILLAQRSSNPSSRATFSLVALDGNDAAVTEC